MNIYSPEIEEFARELVRRVRDFAIKSCDASVGRKVKAGRGKRWAEIAVFAHSGDASSSYRQDA
jgi:hypothetical protein